MNEHLPTLLLQILLVGFTPGPANIYALTMSLRHGRKISLVMWLGMLVGFSIAVSAMALLTHLLGVAFGSYVGYMKVLGAAYIFYLAYWIWRSGGANKTAKSRGGRLAADSRPRCQPDLADGWRCDAQFLPALWSTSRSFLCYRLGAVRTLPALFLGYRR